MHTTTRALTASVSVTALALITLLALALTACATPADAGGTTSAPAVTVTETTTATAEPAADVAPDACLRALDLAEDALLTSSQLIGVAGDILSGPVPAALDAASTMDSAGMDAALADLTDLQGEQEALSAQIDPAPYQAAAAECRAAR